MVGSVPVTLVMVLSTWHTLAVVDRTIIIAVAYLVTGVALVGYDMVAPPLERKLYVSQKNLEVALLSRKPLVTFGDGGRRPVGSPRCRHRRT